MPTVDQRVASNHQEDEPVREIALHILDIVQNSIRAGASRVEITVEEDTPADRLRILVCDNGKGMAPEMASRAVDPFVTTQPCRRVGLGLPLFAAAAERCGGWLKVESKLGQGTKVEAVFQYSHIDRMPLGDMRSTMLGLIASNEGLDIVYRHKVDGEVFTLDTRELRAELGEVPLSDPLVLRWLDEYLATDPREKLVTAF